MEVKITAIHFNADSKLENFIEDKVSKLTQFDENITNSDVNLSLEKSSSKNFDSKVVKIKLKSKGDDYFAEKKSQTFEAATTEAVQALEVQIKKHKEKKLKKN